MGRYVLITNIWGRKPRQITSYYSEWCDFEIKNNPIFVDEERYEFDTLEELNEYIELFKEICKNYEKPSTKTVGYSRWEKSKEDVFDTPNKRRYGYLYGDRETMRLVWGGDKLYRYNKSTNNLKLYDILFRGADEIPKDYKWDDGEYEGWLQYRWGDGKNAVGYVEPEKPKKNDEVIEEEEVEETSYHDDSFDDSFAEEIENAYTKLEDKELIKKLGDRW